MGTIHWPYFVKRKTHIQGRILHAEMSQRDIAEVYINFHLYGLILGCDNYILCRDLHHFNLTTTTLFNISK